MDISHTESLTCCRKWTSLRMFPWWPGARKTSFLKGPSLFNLSSITCKYICTFAFRYLPSRRRSNFATFCGEDQTGSFAGDALLRRSGANCVGGGVRNFPRTHNNWVCVAPTPTPSRHGSPGPGFNGRLDDPLNDPSRCPI